MPSRRRHGWPSHRRGGRWTETGQWVASQLATEARWHGELGGGRDESAQTLKRRELGGGGAGGPMVQLVTKVRHCLCRQAAGAGWAVS